MTRREIVAAVADGARITVNFRDRTAKLNGKLIEVDKCRKCDIQVILDLIEWLYEKYKTSRPSERSESRGRNYFKAKPYEKLTDEEFIMGMPREEARANLEIFVLQTIISDCWEWNWGWFYQCPNDKDLIILKEWITNE